MLSGVVEEPQGDELRVDSGMAAMWLLCRAAAGAVDTIPRGERMSVIASGSPSCRCLLCWSP